MLYRQARGPRVLVVALAVATVLAVAPVAHAQRVHEVRSGQTLSHIAHHYNVSVASLRAANGLRPGSVLRPGQMLTVPQRGVHFVRRGETLSEIAVDHDLTVAELARTNHMDPDDPLREGQRLLLPGFEAADQARKAARRWGRPKHPGRLKLLRVATREKLLIRPLDLRGRLRPGARDRISRLLRDRVTHARHRMHPTLLRLLTRISDHFGGRTIYVISGYRDADAHQYTSEESRHTEGRAIDFHIAGVPNEVLRDYCRKLGNVGVGFYPRSTFVHLDVRKKPGYWVDWSRPGQRPVYRRVGAGPPDQAEDQDEDRDGDQAGDQDDADDVDDVTAEQGDRGQPPDSATAPKTATTPDDANPGA